MEHYDKGKTSCWTSPYCSSLREWFNSQQHYQCLHIDFSSRFLESPVCAVFEVLWGCVPWQPCYYILWIEVEWSSFLWSWLLRQSPELGWWSGEGDHSSGSWRRRSRKGKTLRMEDFEDRRWSIRTDSHCLPRSWSFWIKRCFLVI